MSWEQPKKGPPFAKLKEGEICGFHAGMSPPCPYQHDRKPPYIIPVRRHERFIVHRKNVAARQQTRRDEKEALKLKKLKENQKRSPRDSKEQLEATRYIKTSEQATQHIPRAKRRISIRVLENSCVEYQIHQSASTRSDYIASRNFHDWRPWSIENLAEFLQMKPQEIEALLTQHRLSRGTGKGTQLQARIRRVLGDE